MPLLLFLLAWVGLARADEDHDAFLNWVDRALPAGSVDKPRLAEDEPGRTTSLEMRPTTEAFDRWTEPGYRAAYEVFDDLARYVRERPGRVVPERIGTSLQGRPIWAFHLRNPGQDIHRRLLVFGGIHAMEWISTEVAHEVALELAEHGPPDHVQVTIIPILNPDGRDRVEDDLAADDEVFRRGNARNVDLNRDFAVNREPRAFWRRLIPGYYRTSRAPLSQPETRALDTLAARERFTRAVSLHSFGGFFYAPWSGRFHRPPRADRAEMWALGRTMEQAWGTRAYRTRQLGRWGFFFRAHGSEIDHLYGRYGTRAFLIEVTRSGMSAWKPRTWRWGFRAYNPEKERRYRTHRDNTTDSVLALIRHPELVSEEAARTSGSQGLAPPIEGDEAP